MDGPIGDGKAFDPRPYLRQIQSRSGEEAEYLDVKWRLVWLRTAHPDARITTEHIALSDALAVFRATVEIPNGGGATGYGSQTSADFPDYIEAAETKAIGRALAALGYGTQFARDFDLEEQTSGSEARRLADAPAERPARAVAATERRHASASVPMPTPVPVTAPAPADEPEPKSEREEAHEPGASAELEPTRIRPAARVPTAEQSPTPAAERPATRQRAPSRTATSAATGPSTAEGAASAAARSEPAPTREGRPAEEFDRANFSWNEFWHWARGLGYGDKAQLERLLGIDNLLSQTPRDARRLVETYRREHGEE